MSILFLLGLFILIGIFASLFGFVEMMRRRNDRLCAYLQRVTALTGAAAHTDLVYCYENNLPLPESGWRWEMVDAIDYNRMLWHFWRPFDSFYPNRIFTETFYPSEEIDA